MIRGASVVVSVRYDPQIPEITPVIKGQQHCWVLRERSMPLEPATESGKLSSEVWGGIHTAKRNKEFPAFFGRNVASRVSIQ